MKALSMILAGGVGLAALASAAPAAAQYYPGNPGYGYGSGNVVGQVLGQILGYGQYPYGNHGYNQYNNPSAAVDQCARAVEARLNGNRGGYYGYGRSGYGNYGYSNGADLSWSCEVRYDGRIRDIDLNRRTAYWRGY